MTTLGIWGNNLSLRLPSHVVKAAKLRPGLAMTVRLLDNGDLRVRPAGEPARKRAAADSAAEATVAVGHGAEAQQW